MTPEDIVAHEAGHAVACLLLHIPVTGLDWNEEGGHTWVPELGKDLTKPKARDYMISIMCGPIMEDYDLPQWPPSRDAEQPDEQLLAIFGDYLGLNESSWNESG